MQGTAAAYDLIRFADPARVILVDARQSQAEAAVARVKSLTGTEIIEAQPVDALDPIALRSALLGVDVVLSCVPYWMHPHIAPVAIEAGVSMCDLGGNTDVTLQTLGLNETARAAGVTLVPDCGLAPGLVNSLGASLVEAMDPGVSVRLYCGVLPAHPQPPLNYKTTFNVEGLVTEYDYEAVALRGGEIVRIPTLTELETVHIPEMGEMEAFVTSGGTSTAPYTFQGRVKDYEYKTLRFPGHCAIMRLFKDFGFWREDEVEVRGVRVRPKDVFCRVFGEELGKIQDFDQCAIRGVAEGTVKGEPTRIVVDIYDRQDPVTGFTAMERLTGFSLSIVAAAVAEGRVVRGAVRYESALPGQFVLDELAKRGIHTRKVQE